MKIIEHDFGHERRHKARELRRLLDLDALHEVNLRDNPLPYLERASERIFQLESALFDANLAGLEVLSERADETETVTIQKIEYERLLACRSIVREAFERLVKSHPND